LLQYSDKSKRRHISVLVTTQFPIQITTIVPTPMHRLPAEQMFHTWMKTLLQCGY